MQIPTFEQHWSCYFCTGWFCESQIWTWSKQKCLLDAQPAAPDPWAFCFSAAGGTMVPFLLPIPNLKRWVICHGPKGSRKAWPNLTKPEGHKKDFQLNVSDLLALPIPSQLQRANNFHVMAMGEEAWRGIRKFFLLKLIFRWSSTLFAQTECVLGWLKASQLPWQLSLSSSYLLLCAGDLPAFNATFCILAWRSRSPQPQSPIICVIRFALTSLKM